MLRESPMAKDRGGRRDMKCPNCAAAQLNRGARFCSKYGAPLAGTRPRRTLGVIRFIALPLILVGRILAYPNPAPPREDTVAQGSGRSQRSDQIRSRPERRCEARVLVSGGRDPALWILSLQGRHHSASHGSIREPRAPRSASLSVIAC